MKYSEPARCLLVYENVFESEIFIQNLEAECAQDWGYLSWYQTTVGSREHHRTDPHYRSSMGCEISPLYTPVEKVSNERLIPLVEEWQKISESLEGCIWHYRNMFNVDLSGNEGYRVLKYGRGAEYRGHIDHGPDNSRVLSIVAFMNDDFSGGELVFPIVNATIKPKKGSVVMFPSNFPYFHYASPVGLNDLSNKYSLVTWFK